MSTTIAGEKNKAFLDSPNMDGSHSYYWSYRAVGNYSVDYEDAQDRLPKTQIEMQPQSHSISAK